MIIAGRKELIRKWLLFILGIITFYSFIFIVTPLITNHLLQKQYVKVKNLDLDCTPLLYTESEEGMEAIYRLSNSDL